MFKSQPFETKEMVFLEIANEVILIQIMYLLPTFTDAIPVISTQMSSLLILFMLGVLVFINLVFVVYNLIKKGKQKLINKQK